MQFQQSPVYDEANKILFSNVSYQTEYEYSFELYINNEIIKVDRLMDVLIDKNYLTNYTPIVICSVLIGMGTYDSFIVPKRRELRGRLIMRPVLGSSTTQDTKRNTINIEGRAVLKEQDSFSDKVPNENFGLELGNKMGFIKIHFQLLNPLIEKMMVTNAGGTYRVMTSPDFVKSFLLSFSQVIDNEKSYKVNGVNFIEEGKNTEIIPNFIIPTNIKLVDVPGYVNAKISGIYPAGFGYFLDRNKWFIYPTFNTRLAENSASGFLTIIKVPRAAIPDMKNTFRLQGNNIFILTQSELNIFERAEQQFLTKGNGARWVDAKNMVENFIHVDNNGKKVVDSSKNVNELVVSEEASKINNITGTGKITSNRFRELSKLAERNGSVANVMWPKSNIEYLYPGMPVKVIAWSNTVVKEIYGVLLGCTEMISNVNEGMVNAPIYQRNASLSLFLEKDNSGYKAKPTPTF